MENVNFYRYLIGEKIPYTIVVNSTCFKISFVRESISYAIKDIATSSPKEVEVHFQSACIA